MKMENIVSALTLSFCVLLSSCDFVDGDYFNKKSHVRDENYERIADRVTSQVARKMKKEKGLRCIGVGGGMMSNIQRMSMSFQVFHEVDLSQARELLVYAITEYLKAINESKEVRPYLHEYPFKSENIKIMIWVYEPNGDDVPFDQIAFMSFVQSVLKYDLSDDPKTNADRELHRETYEEALKIVNAEAVSKEAKAS